jgi:HK97 family phage major capsid protein
MNTTEKILQGIKQTLETGSKVKIDLKEASNLTGSGDGVGGRTYFDDAFAALRYANPFRQGARQIKASGSSVQFVAKTGNAANSTNPWLYAVTPNSGSPNIATSIWQLPTRVITAQLPIRTAAMDDINYLNEALVKDLFLEFSQLEAQSMATNNDQSGSTTTSTGGVNGLRGLSYYNTSTSSASYGSSGTAITNGVHTVLKKTFTAAAVTYDNIVDTVNLLPAQYWSLPTTAWMMHPALIVQLRKLKNTANLPIFIETGENDGGALANVFGFPVIPNPYLETPAVGSLSAVLANWDQFMTIADVEEMNVQAMEQTAPGFVTLYAEKRLVSTIRDPFAGVYLIGA